MTTRYVRLSGNDSNNGTSAATAWRTLGKALGSSGAASGDTIYVGAGTYRELVTVLLKPTAETKVIGDVTGTYTGDAGEVVLSAYLTNDATAPASSDSTLQLNDSHQNYTFENLTIIGADKYVGCVSAWRWRNIVFRKCTFINSGYDSVGVDVAPDSVANSGCVIDSCIFLSSGYAAGLYVHFIKSTSAAYDSGLVIKNCLFIGHNAVEFFVSGSDTYVGGGATVVNCTMLSMGHGWGVSTDTGTSTTYPVKVINCMLWDAQLYAATAGQLTENYNYIIHATPRTNVTAGAQSITGNTLAPRFSVGQEFLTGRLPRPCGSPTEGSPFLGRGADASLTLTVDALNRPRPAGGQSTSKGWGYLERHDTAVKETSVVDVSPAIKIVGPGDHDFFIPVNAAQTTISVKVRYDSNHGTGNKPQAILLAAPDIGVSTETKTATVGVDTWETLTFSAFTPTASGVVTVRLVSRAANGNGVAYFDTVSVS